MRIVIEDEVKPHDVREGGWGGELSWVSNSCPSKRNDDSDTTPGVFFHFRSQDVEGKAHDIFRQFIGKKVRITLESLDPLDQLSEIE